MDSFPFVVQGIQSASHGGEGVAAGEAWLPGRRGS